jgi:Protein of unknown function (DUF3500)
MKLFRFVVPLAFALACASLHAHDASAEMAMAANNFLADLTPEQKAKVTFDVKDAERENWHYIPRVRKGLPFKELNPSQRLLAEALLASGLSNHGYEKAVSIMSLDEVLAAMEQGKGPLRDPENYYLSIFGAPGGPEPWGWRVEGHHLSLNYTASGDETPSMTPSFFGSNPGEVRTGPRTGMRVLAAEEDLGRALVKSLDPEQLKEALIMETPPKDILNIPGRNDTTAMGLSRGKMKPEQQAMLAKLIKEYLFRCRPDVAAEDWAKIEKAGFDKISFAWAGGLDRGQPHYYRVQGGHFVLEYDNTQNNANHVHSVWRDFDHDFGEDLLKAHYESSHAKP